MAKLQWIRIGQGSKKQELESVILTLKKRWQKRYKYRIDEVEDDERQPFQLLIRHA